MLIYDNAFILVLSKYANFAIVFSSNPIAKLPENNGVNNHPINLVEGQQPPYGPIYSLKSVKLKILKMYIETNLANGFIRSSKSLNKPFIFFVYKPIGNLQFCVNYQDFNNLTIKNRYPLSLIRETLNWQDQAKKFT